MGGSMVERYQKLGLKESLNQPYRYPIACDELSLILRNAYSKIPKNLQSLIFRESLTAFGLLPEMQTQAAISAAHGLLQSMEAALPKQKKALAASEFKQAMVTHRRRRKVQPVLEGRSQLPQDVLVHVFGFLDLKSLVTASSVCRSWSVAASDNHLWQSIHISFFGKSNEIPNIIRFTNGVERTSFTLGNTGADNVDWKDAFKRAYRGISVDCDPTLVRWNYVSSYGFAWFIDHLDYFRVIVCPPSFREVFTMSACFLLPFQIFFCVGSLFILPIFFDSGISKKVTSQRGFCKQCNSIVWLNNSKCSNGEISDEHQIMPVSLEQIVDYVIEESIPSSDSDSDSDDSVDGSLFKLWAYPKRVSEPHP